MKKLSILLIVFLCMFFGSLSAFAEESMIDEYDETTIIVTNTVGTGNYKVNDKTVKGQASESIKGKTFIPVNIITDALNATLKVDLKAKTAVITYNDVEIKLTDKKSEAVIAGKKVKMDAAPYIKNSVFLAPVSFLADTLGADLTYKSGVITFTKEIANPNSIKDFSTLIKKTTKSKIGDSYYKWSMMLPDDLKLDYRSFTGDMNDFVAQDDSYSVYVYIDDLEEDTTVEDIANSMYEEMDYYTLIDFGIKESNGLEYVEFVFKDEYGTYQQRIFLSGKQQFTLTLCTENEDSYLDDKYQNILDSFSLKYSRDGSVEDLSDINSSGYRKYQDTRMKWSINMLPEWEEYKDSDIQNEVEFYGKNEASLVVKVYSLDKGETLDSITKASIDRDNARLNNDLYKVIKQETVTINGVKCSKVHYTLQFADKLHYGWDIFFVDKNYKYIIGCEISEDDYNNSRQKRLVEGMLNSFKFTELNVKAIGKLLDPNKVIINEKQKTVNTDYFTLKIPSSFSTGVDSEQMKSYSSNDINFMFFVQNMSLTDFVQEFDKSLNERTDIKIESKVTSNDKGTTNYKYVCTYEDDGVSYTEESYILENKGTVIFLDLTVKSIYYGTKNKETMNSIWQSLTLK